MPIQTAEEVTFTIDGESQVLRPGELWEVNNMRMHEVENASSIDRIHLIMDWAHPMHGLDWVAYAGDRMRFGMRGALRSVRD